MKHLVDRFREGRISVADFETPQEWLNFNPGFPKFTLAGEEARHPRHFRRRQCSLP